MTKTLTTGWIATSLAAFAIGFISMPVFAQTVDCGCALRTETIQSDETNTVVGDGNAVAVATSSAWTASIPGATWIWKSGATLPNETVGFEQTFTVVGTVLSATLNIASDNSYKVFIDNVQVAADASATNFTLATQDVYNLTAVVTPGVHTLRIEVTNNGVFSSLNPAGLLYRLVIESEDCPPTVWSGITITICNSGTITNLTSASASTGGNTAEGSRGGRGGRGGDVEAEADDSEASGNNGGAQAGDGGNGGNASRGGIVITGTAISTANTLNSLNGTEIELAGTDLNSSAIEVGIDNDNCKCNLVDNKTRARARTGGNDAKGSEGGDGGPGGEIEAEAEDGDAEANGNNGGAVGGNGGSGGSGGLGGFIGTGFADSTATTTNKLNFTKIKLFW